jgi:hypothetical protein
LNTAIAVGTVQLNISPDSLVARVEMNGVADARKETILEVERNEPKGSALVGKRKLRCGNRSGVVRSTEEIGHDAEAERNCNVVSCITNSLVKCI